MEVSLGIYAIICILFYVIVPGYIFRRFYCNGEFSKQVSLSSNTTSSIFSSLIIGVFLQLFVILIYNLCSFSPIDLESILIAFDTHFISNNAVPNNESSKFNGFSSNLFNYYLPYLGMIYILAGTFGFFISKLIYIAKIDATTKIFRFKNEWHYLLSGRILYFTKIKSNRRQTDNLKVLYVLVDVLVGEVGGQTQLYSGLVADYELNHTDICKLEKLHLLRAQRWSPDENGIRVKKNIPGNLFTIMGDQIININSTFICEQQEDKQRRRFRNKRIILLTAQILSAVIFIFISFSFFFNFNFFRSEWYSQILLKSFLEKFLIVYTINMIFGLLTPFIIENKGQEEGDNKEDKISFVGLRAYLFKIILLLILIGVLLYMNGVF